MSRVYATEAKQMKYLHQIDTRIAALNARGATVCNSRATVVLFLGFAHRADALSEPRNLARGSLPMHEPLFRRVGDDRFCFFKRCERRGFVAGGNRLLDFARVAPHATAARLVCSGAADGLTCSL